MCACMLSLFSRVQLFVILWTVVYQDPLSMGFSRQEYWNRLPCPPSGDLPNPAIEPVSLVSPALAGRFFTTSATSPFIDFSDLYYLKSLPMCVPASPLTSSTHPYPIHFVPVALSY